MTPHFRTFPYETNRTTSTSETLTPSSTSSQSDVKDHFDHAFDVTLSSLYGVSDGVTLALALGYTPKQSPPDGSAHALIQGSGLTQTADQTLTSSAERLNAGLALSYRPRSNVELALNAHYSHANTTNDAHGQGNISLTGTPYPTTGSSAADQKQSIYDVSLSFVVLGN